ncbi:MAG: protein-disulfide reductase DsbD family protein [Luteolibacter sp.]
MPRLFSVLCLLLATLVPIYGQFSFNPAGGAKRSSEAILVSETTGITPGQPFTVALKLTHPENWHSYYQNSGGVEQAPAIQWILPAGFSAGPIQWPTPSVKEGLGGTSFIYTGSPVFLVEITPPASLAADAPVTLTANATWQICEHSCINEEKSFTLTLTVFSGTNPDPEHTELFTAARRALPREARDWKIHAISGADHVTVQLDIPANIGFSVEGRDFVPDQPFLRALSDGGSLVEKDGRWELTLQRKKTDFLDQPIPQGDLVSGILTGSEAYKIPETTLLAPAAPKVIPPNSGKLLRVLGSMFLGGLILNLMPCVFPVIGLKIMGFVQQSGQDRKKIVLHGSLFTLGVLLSFLILSGILFFAREAANQGGQELGWGYQLQVPWVVLLLLLLMFVLGLNMYGVFEIGTRATSIGGSLQAKHGLSGSFFSGVLATIVATPCSAPFLGVAIGAAIGFPAAQFFSAFISMALGLSAPYLLLSIFPSLVNLLPRPGAWMESFKQGMSFLLFATAGYLLWVYAGQIGLENLLYPLFGLSAIAIAAWIYGRWNLPSHSSGVRAVAVVLVLAFAAGGIYLAKPPKPSELTWELWSEERVSQLLTENKPVYIDFTAQWCATCQVNKKRAYTPEVIQLIREKGIVTLKADKTNPDPAIDAALRKLDRTAIPVNVLLVPGKPPIVTPELISPDYLKELFNKEIP